MCGRISSVAEETPPENMNKEFRYYSITAHQIVLVIWLLIISLFLIFIFSLFIGGIERLYQEWDWMWTGEDNRESGTSGVGFNLGVLPDFLGGMVGILVGFFLEWLIFEKIKNLSKYRTIISCLKLEFDKILGTIKQHPNSEFREVVLDDIVLSAENSSVIFNLSSYYIFRSRTGKTMLDKLQNLHGLIDNRNILIAGINEQEQRLERFNVIHNVTDTISEKMQIKDETKNKISKEIADLKESIASDKREIECYTKKIEDLIKNHFFIIIEKQKRKNTKE